MQVGRSEAAPPRQQSEAGQRLEHGPQTRVIELQAWCPAAVRRHGRLPQGVQLATIDERLQDVLLHFEVTVVGGGHRLPQLGQVFDALVHPQVGGVIAGRLGAQDQVIAHILLDRAALVVTADDRLPQVVIEDLGLQARVGALGDAAAEDQGDLVRVADGTLEVQQALVQAVQCGATLEDQVGAVLDLADEEAITEALMATLPIAEERHQLGQPAMGTGLDVGGRELVGQFLQPRRVGAGTEGVTALLEGNALRAQSARQPLVAVEANPSVEGEVRANPQKHAAEVLVLEIEVVLPDKAVTQLDVIALAWEADRHAGVLAALENDREAVLALQALVEGLFRCKVRGPGFSWPLTRLPSEVILWG